MYLFGFTTWNLTLSDHFSPAVQEKSDGAVILKRHVHMRAKSAGFHAYPAIPNDTDDTLIQRESLGGRRSTIETGSASFRRIS